MGFRRETPRDDDRRTRALLDAADHAFAQDAGSDLGDAFQDAVMNGLGTDKAAAAAGQYPPRGHNYPRR